MVLIAAKDIAANLANFIIDCTEGTKLSAKFLADSAICSCTLAA
jgi:hypothetical protein